MESHSPSVTSCSFTGRHGPMAASSLARREVATGDSTRRQQPERSPPARDQGAWGAWGRTASSASGSEQSFISSEIWTSIATNPSSTVQQPASCAWTRVNGKRDGDRGERRREHVGDDRLSHSRQTRGRGGLRTHLRGKFHYPQLGEVTILLRVQGVRPLEQDGEVRGC